jgi:hypothetical protein
VHGDLDPRGEDRPGGKSHQEPLIELEVGAMSIKTLEGKVLPTACITKLR